MRVCATVLCSVLAYEPALVVVPAAEPNTSDMPVLVSPITAFGTALAYASSTETVTLAPDAPSATKALGDTAMAERLAFGLPATNTTARVSTTVPDVAAIVFASALVEVIAEAYKPLALVAPLAPLPPPNTSLALLLEKVTGKAGTTLAYASRRVSATATAATPLAVS